MRRHATAALLVFLCLVAAACGARLSDEQTAAVRASGSQTAGDGQPGGSPGTGGPTAPGTVGGVAGAAGTEGTGPTAAAPGTPDGAAEGGGGGGGPAPAPESCGPGGGDTDVGVTADTIRVGNVSIITGPIPGFGETARNAVQAYFDFRNSQGGICGRQVELVNSDDRFDAGVNRAEHERLAQEVLGFVGSLSVVDGGGATVLAGTNIPDVGLATDDARIALPNNFSPSPIDLSDGGNNYARAATYFKENDAVSKAAVVFPNQATARKRAQGYSEDFRRAGLEVVVEAEVAVTETNYTGVANRIKSAGADIVITTLEVNGMSQLAKALAQQGYRDAVPNAVPSYGAQVYGRQFLQLAGDAAEGTKLGVAFALFEDAGQNPAVARLLEWYQRSAPGSEPDFFSIMGWVSADMFATAVEAAGSELTRDKVIAALGTLTSFDAQGLIAPINPAAKQPASCFMVAAVEGGNWVRKAPAEGFICP